MVIAAETDEEAMAKWQSYNDGVDLDAIAVPTEERRGRDLGQWHGQPPRA